MTKPIEAAPARSPAAARATLPIGVCMRRLALGAALCAAAWLTAGKAEARPHGRPAGGIAVDVTPLLAQGLGGFAEVVRADLTQALQAQFAGRLGPGERLVVVVRGISLRSYIGGDSIRWPDNDYLDGVVTLVGPNGQVLATQKILSVSPSSSGGAWYIAGGELRRTAALSQSFAAWARRYIPG
ncbi:MAG: hypothetical protein ACHQAY_18465 [Hyphomicrobiales bacterium]